MERSTLFLISWASCAESSWAACGGSGHNSTVERSVTLHVPIQHVSTSIATTPLSREPADSRGLKVCSGLFALFSFGVECMVHEESFTQQAENLNKMSIDEFYDNNFRLEVFLLSRLSAKQRSCSQLSRQIDGARQV